MKLKKVSIQWLKIKARNGAFSQRKVNGRKIHYRGVLAIRQGVKTVVNKRLPGQKVRLTAAQKLV